MAFYLGLVSLLTILVPPLDKALAAPPEVPQARLPAPTLGDFMRNSTMRPSAASLAALAREGRSYDLNAPVFMPPRAAAGDPMKVVGEVAVLEGAADVVTDFGNGQFGLRYDNGRQDPSTISARFIKQFGDEYDFVVVWTAFWDYGADGLAYYVPILQDTYGLGDSRYDQRTFWGSSSRGKLQGFLNMKSIDVYGNIRNTNNYVYPVMGQEFSHRWLAQMKFQRANGTTSAATLGRDAAHWSTLLQADGSVQDGNTWRDNNDGTFSNLENMVRYSPLDLYGMGLYAPEEVPDFFLIENAKYRSSAVNGLTTFPVGAKVTGDRTDITIADIVAANGARRPAFADAAKDFRMAFILVTRPGDTAADVQDQISQIETFRLNWEAKFSEWTYGRGTMCTRVTAKCDRPALKITNQSARELEGDGDEMPEPGEKVAISLTLENTGGGVATAPSLTLTLPDGAADLAVAAPTITLGDLAPGVSKTFDDAFIVTLGDDATCGVDVVAGLEASIADYVVQGSVTFPVGYKYVFYDDFSTDRGWQVDAFGEDTAASGMWERNLPLGVDAGQAGLDFQTQPESDVAGNGRAFVTGAAPGKGLGGDDLDGGTTSVVSPPIALAETTDPRLSYFTWRTGLDFNSVEGQVSAEDNDVLTVELSPDEGVTWLAIDSDISNDQEWKQKEFRILDIVPTLPPAIRLRFTARDVEPQSLSEAAIDNVRVWDLQASCYEPVVVPTDPTDPTEPTDPTDPTDPMDPTDPTDPIDPGGNPGQAIGGRNDGGCAGGGAGSLALVGGALLAVGLARRRRGGTGRRVDVQV